MPGDDRPDRLPEERWSRAGQEHVEVAPFAHASGHAWKMPWDEEAAETEIERRAAPGSPTARRIGHGALHKPYQRPPVREASTGKYTAPQRHSGVRRKEGASRPYAFPATKRPRQDTRQRPARSPFNIQGRKVHWLLPLGIAMLALLVLWELGSLALTWGLARYDDLRYGYPRTYQVDRIVGQGDNAQHPSHFIAMNLHRQAIVIEVIAGNPAKSISYAIPYLIGGQGGDQVPVTLDFRDVNGDSRLDMIVDIHLSSGDKTFVFINTGQKFRPPTSKDHIHL